MKENTNLNKLNPVKNDIIKVKRESKLTQKIMEIQPVQTIDISKNDSRNITAPNKNGGKQKKNYKHLKITAKNKETKDIASPNIINNKQCNYLGNLLSNKILGRSLPKNYNNKLIGNSNINIDIPNYSSNNIKRITSSNNIIAINNNNRNENFQKIKNGNHKNNSNGFKNNKQNNIKEIRDNKFINQNNLKKSCQQEGFNDV